MVKPVGKHQVSMYTFLKKYPKGWHGYSKDTLTKRVVSSLKNKGLISTNRFSQMRLRKK